MEVLANIGHRTSTHASKCVSIVFVYNLCISLSLAQCYNILTQVHFTTHSLVSCSIH
jgi:hypothetical protein